MKGGFSSQKESYSGKDALNFLVQGALVLGISSLLISFLKPYLLKAPPQSVSIAAALLAIACLYALLTIYTGGKK